MTVWILTCLIIVWLLVLFENILCVLIYDILFGFYCIPPSFFGYIIVPSNNFPAVRLHKYHFCSSCFVVLFIKITVPLFLFILIIKYYRIILRVNGKCSA